MGAIESHILIQINSQPSFRYCLYSKKNLVYRKSASYSLLKASAQRITSNTSTFKIISRLKLPKS